MIGTVLDNTTHDKEGNAYDDVKIHRKRIAETMLSLHVQ